MHLLPWLLNSTDMSPNERVWNFVVRRLARDPMAAASKDEFWVRVEANRNSLPQADIQKIFDSMPRHIAALTAAGDGYTK